MDDPTLLFRQRYQPTTLEACQHPEIARVLREKIEKRNPMLLVGDPGTGKTTWLHAILDELRHQKKFKVELHVIHTLKEQGIHYYRNDTKTFCQTATLANQIKVVLMDDVDQMNEQGQQVFRHFIDHYPAVLFLASCTHLQHVIESIQTRFHIVYLPPLNYTQLSTLFDRITDDNGIHIDTQAKEYIVTHSLPYANQMIHVLERFYLLEGDEDVVPKTLEDVQETSFQAFEEYTRLLLFLETPVEAIRCLYRMHDQGFSVIDLLDHYFSFLKRTSILSDDQKYNMVQILCKYISIFHTIHENKIELSLFTNELHTILHKK